MNNYQSVQLYPLSPIKTREAELGSCDFVYFGFNFYQLLQSCSTWIKFRVED